MDEPVGNAGSVAVLGEEDDKLARLEGKESADGKAIGLGKVAILVEGERGKVIYGDEAVGLGDVERQLDIHHPAMILHGSLLPTLPEVVLHIDIETVAMDGMTAIGQGPQVVVLKKSHHVGKERVEGHIAGQIFNLIYYHFLFSFD